MDPLTLVELDEQTGLMAEYTTDPDSMNRWFNRPFALRKAKLGVRRPDFAAFSRSDWFGCIIRDRGGVERGAIAFFRSDTASAFIHLALTTAGSRSDTAFRLACAIASQVGISTVKFFFNTKNKAVEQFARRLGLLETAHVLPFSGDEAEGEWWVGQFTPCHS